MTRSTELTLVETTPGDIVRALQLVIADFQDRETHTVTGAGGRQYEFFPTAITDNIPPLGPDLTDAICLLSRLHIDPATRPTLGVGEEDRGAMIVADILREYRLPRTLARWTPSGAPGEVSLPLANEYVPEGSTRIYLNGTRPGDRVLLVDDLISTGGTLIALVQAIRQAGAEIVDAFTIGEKSENVGRQFLMESTGVRIKTLIVSELRSGSHGLRSHVKQVNLGRLNADMFEAVAAQFPAGFCRPGHGH